MEKYFYVYILAGHRKGTLYIGVTSNLINRIWQHKEKITIGFSSKYNANRFVYYETHNTAESGIML